MTPHEPDPDHADDDAQQQWVRDRLALEPSPQMPSEVQAKIMAALTAEAEQRELQPPATSPRERNRRPWLLPLAAAAAFVILAGIVIIPLTTRSNNVESTAAGTEQNPTAAVPAPACGIPAATGADLAPVTSTSGATYTPASFKAQSAELVNRESPACADQVGLKSAGTTMMSDGPSESPSTQGVTAPDGSVAPTSPGADDEHTVIRCLVAVIPGQIVVAIDRARFAGQPVVVAVVRHQPMHAYAIDCHSRPQRVVYDMDL